MEITKELDFTLEEQTLLDMHSVLNVMNVVYFELINLSDHFGSPRPLSRLMYSVERLGDLLRDPDEAERQIENVDSFIEEVTAVVGTAIAQRSAENDHVVVEAQQNLESVFDILRVRAREIVARHKNPDSWVEHEIEQLKRNFLNVFQAIERNSHGAYRIVYNIAEHEERDYLVNFSITSVTQRMIRMPAIFQDVMRDLIANARKYTPGGGTITAGLYNSGTELRFVVSDNGLGIPAEELERIVEFGTRGSNVAGKPTRGGGFGLTKAYYVTRKFGGRMWIDSSVGEGTRIEIRIPEA